MRPRRAVADSQVVGDGVRVLASDQPTQHLELAGCQVVAEPVLVVAVQSSQQLHNDVRVWFLTSAPRALDGSHDLGKALAFTADRNRARVDRGEKCSALNRRREHHDRGPLGRGGDGSDCRDRVAVREAQVHDDDVKAMPSDPVYGVVRMVCCFYVVSMLAQRSLQSLAEQDVVVTQQDPHGQRSLHCVGRRVVGC